MAHQAGTQSHFPSGEIASAWGNSRQYQGCEAPALAPLSFLGCGALVTPQRAPKKANPKSQHQITARMSSLALIVVQNGPVPAGAWGLRQVPIPNQNCC